VPGDWDRFRFETARRGMESMSSKFIKAFAVCAFVIGTAAITHTQQNGSAGQNVDVGKYEYETHCAECHGLSGKGDGPYGPLLRSGTVLPDLTELSKKNNGVFPFARVSETIENGVPGAHGTKEMPIWGTRYRIEAGQGVYDENTETYVRTRILALTEYIYSLQAK
jgi:mono/diheme cytochrome c family protein